MLTHPPVLLYIIAFDLVIGVLLSRYLWVVRSTERKAKVPLSWIAIICLVNLSGAFCGAMAEEAVASLGGLALAVLILPAIAGQPNPVKRPNQSTARTAPSVRGSP